MMLAMYIQELECFKGIFSLQIKGGVKPYQIPARHVAYTLQETFRKELQKLQGQKILVPLGTVV